jgi:hypothetical protein
MCDEFFSNLKTKVYNEEVKFAQKIVSPLMGLISNLSGSPFQALIDAPFLNLYLNHDEGTPNNTNV